MFILFVEEITMCITDTAKAKQRNFINSPTNLSGELNCSVQITEIPSTSMLELHITEINYNLYQKCSTNCNYFSILSSGKNSTVIKPGKSIFHIFDGGKATASISFYTTNMEYDHSFRLIYRGETSITIAYI